MTTYREIHGRSIQALSTDPTENVAEGQIWYNTASDTFKSVLVTEATSSSAPISTARAMCAGGGIQTASWLCGGSTGAPTTGTTHTENYNGSGWTTSGNLSNARAHFGATGPQTSGVAVGGGPPFSPSPGGAQNNTEEYSGSTWTSGTAVPTNVWSNGMFGTQTAGVTVGSEPNGTNYVFEYDGSSWVTGGTMNAIRSYVGSAGTLTAGIVFAGLGPPPNTSDMIATELYDGTNWTTAPNLNTGNTYSPFAGGSQTAALKAGGIVTPSPPAVSNVIEKYDGSSWSTSPATLATGRGYSKGQTQNSPSNTAGLFAGGTTAAPAASAVSSTEEFNISANVITAAAWAAGGTMGTARQRAGGFGNAQNSAVVAAGGTAPPASALSATEEYNGTGWTAGNPVNTARFNMTAFGTESAGVLSGIGTPSVTYGGTTEEYDGTTWTTVNPYAAPGANYRSSCGPQTAGLLAGGVAPAPAEMTNAVEEYDGTNWTSGTTLPQYQSYNCQAGTQTAAINGGGSAGPAAPGPVTANTISLEYDGTNWTTAPNANLASPTQVRSFNGGTGTQSDAMFVGGGTNLNGIRYDGTAFRTDAAYSAVRGETSAAGLAPAGTATIFAGAPVPSVGNTTQEFTDQTTALNVKTLTQS